MRPVPIVLHGQRRADPPHLAREPLPLAEAPAHAGRKASGPVPDDEPPTAVLTMLDEIEQRIRGAYQALSPGHDLFEQVSDL
jgi:hypothetical protein